MGFRFIRDSRVTGVSRFTGWHMFITLVVFFGTIMAVNFTMARFAISSFGGIVVNNSYVASQDFNRWLAQAEAQDELGWDAVTTWRPDGRLVVAVSGAPEALDVRAIARRPLGRIADLPIDFTVLDNGRYLSVQSLPEGRWILRLQIAHDGHEWRREETLQ